MSENPKFKQLIVHLSSDEEKHDTHQELRDICCLLKEQFKLTLNGPKDHILFESSGKRGTFRDDQAVFCIQEDQAVQAKYLIETTLKDHGYEAENVNIELGDTLEKKQHDKKVLDQIRQLKNNYRETKRHLPCGQSCSDDYKLNTFQHIYTLENLHTTDNKQPDKIISYEEGIKKMRDKSFLERFSHTQMMKIYGSKLASYIEAHKSLKKALNHYFNDNYKDFQKLFWKAVSVSVFVTQITTALKNAFPEHSEEIHDWANNQGEDFIEKYNEYNVFERVHRTW